MDDERVAGGTALGLEDTGGSFGRTCVGSQAVYSLGWKRDELPLAKQPGRLAKRAGRIGRLNLRTERLFAGFSHGSGSAISAIASFMG